jgi:hypothetical protein
MEKIMSYIKFFLIVTIFIISLIQPKIVSAKIESKTELYQWPVPKGEITDWKTVNKMLPVGSRFQVIDVDTGLTFNVQRRAGSTHADIQPLTRSDTNVMKIIYKGKWSWDRNDIVIKIKDRYIAASMNGMPHGHGALQNGFPGHSCIHFQGSTTHKRHNVDLAHHLMIAKAATKLDDFTSRLSPLEIVQAYEIGINHQEPVILNHILTSQKENPLKKFKYLKLYFDNEDDEQIETPYVKRIETTARVQTDESNRLKRKDITFLLFRTSVLEQWRIAEVSF